MKKSKRGTQFIYSPFSFTIQHSALFYFQFTCVVSRGTRGMMQFPSGKFFPSPLSRSQTPARACHSRHPHILGKKNEKKIQFNSSTLSHLCRVTFYKIDLSTLLSGVLSIKHDTYSCLLYKLSKQYITAFGYPGIRVTS